MIQKFKTKPGVVEAILYTRENAAEVIAFIGIHNCAVWMDSSSGTIFSIKGQRDYDGPGGGLREKTLDVHPGDWIVKEEDGTYRPCKPDVFAATYEPVTDRDARG